VAYFFGATLYAAALSAARDAVLQSRPDDIKQRFARTAGDHRGCDRYMYEKSFENCDQWIDNIGKLFTTLM